MRVWTYQKIWNNTDSVAHWQLSLYRSRLSSCQLHGRWTFYRIFSHMTNGKQFGVDLKRIRICTGDGIIQDGKKQKITCRFPTLTALFHRKFFFITWHLLHIIDTYWVMFTARARRSCQTTSSFLLSSRASTSWTSGMTSEQVLFHSTIYVG